MVTRDISHGLSTRGSFTRSIALAGLFASLVLTMSDAKTLASESAEEEFSWLLSVPPLSTIGGMTRLSQAVIIGRVGDYQIPNMEISKTEENSAKRALDDDPFVYVRASVTVLRILCGKVMGTKLVVNLAVYSNRHVSVDTARTFPKPGTTVLIFITKKDPHDLSEVMICTEPGQYKEEDIRVPEGRDFQLCSERAIIELGKDSEAEFAGAVSGYARFLRQGDLNRKAYWAFLRNLCNSKVERISTDAKIDLAMSLRFAPSDLLKGILDEPGLDEDIRKYGEVICRGNQRIWPDEKQLREALDDLSSSNEQRKLQGLRFLHRCDEEWLTQNVPKFSDQLGPLLECDRYAVRTEAAWILSYAKDPVVVPFFLDRLSTNGFGALASTIKALRRICGEGAPAFDPVASNERRAKMIVEWKIWWDKHRNDPQFHKPLPKSAPPPQKP